MRMLQRHGQTAWFLAVYRLVADPGDPLELNVKAEDEETFTLSLKWGARTIRHAVPGIKAMAQGGGDIP